jgi:hypothetical protein
LLGHGIFPTQHAADYQEPERHVLSAYTGHMIYVYWLSETHALNF